MSRVITCVLLGAAAAALSVTSAFAYEWTFSNQSRWDIHEIYISSCRNDRWGQDRLGRHQTLNSGESASLQVSAGCYDILLVDEQGDKCDVRDKVVEQDTTLTITTGQLERCEGYR